jgi:hypothetical protein
MAKSHQHVKTEPGKAPDEVRDISVSHLLTMFARQERVTLALYNLRILGSLGVLGFVYHSSEFTYNWMVKTGITIGFVLFAIGNGYGAVASQRITASVSDALKTASIKYGYTSEVLRAHSAISVKRMKFYQVGLTFIALLLLWFPNIAEWFKARFHN